MVVQLQIVFGNGDGKGIRKIRLFFILKCCSLFMFLLFVDIVVLVFVLDSKIYREMKKKCNFHFTPIQVKLIDFLIWHKVQHMCEEKHNFSIKIPSQLPYIYCRYSMYGLVILCVYSRRITRVYLNLIKILNKY